MRPRQHACYNGIRVKVVDVVVVLVQAEGKVVSSKPLAHSVPSRHLDCRCFIARQLSCTAVFAWDRNTI